MYTTDRFFGGFFFSYSHIENSIGGHGEVIGEFFWYYFFQNVDGQLWPQFQMIGGILSLIYFPLNSYNQVALFSSLYININLDDVLAI